MSRVRGIVGICSSCQQAQQQLAHPLSALLLSRAFTSATRHHDRNPSKTERQDVYDKQDEKEPGALSQRLQDMADEAMSTGSKSDRNTLSSAGFSEDLKRQLEERIAQSSFRSQNQQAQSVANLPSSAGTAARQQAEAQVWRGQETLHDATLRMLDDATPKLRTARKGSVKPPPSRPLNLKPQSSRLKNVSAADRLASARDRTSIYAVSQHAGMTEEEREKMRKELKDRFSPGARPMPTSLQGLTSLANERIEDAIARGQFKNIQRGKGINTERDYAANSPFLDTTEYFMNKMIQKQEIVPPWIEKQQELVKLVGGFRARLRNDWRRHAARMISSQGGSVSDQVLKAQSFALTEDMVNPRPVRTERMTGIDSTGNLTTITVEERIAAGILADKDEIQTSPEFEIKVSESRSEDTPVVMTDSSLTAQPSQPPDEDLSKTSPGLLTLAKSSSSDTQSAISSVLPMPFPFRDPNWEATESAYHNLAIKEINDLTRSYNLMAPKVAQKPYYTVQRELNRCFSEVAPSIPDEIMERSRKPKIRIEVIGHHPGGVMEKFQGTGHVGRVRDEDQSKGYGFKQFWRDLFRKNETSQSAERRDGQRSIA